METRVFSDSSVKTEDYEILLYLYKHGAATVQEIEDHSGLSRNEVVNRLSDLIYWGYIEESAEQ
jgi:DNA-binding MarR family transcriptional regulator